jgi:NADH dehydrogenase FAD-containing subunit
MGRRRDLSRRLEDHLVTSAVGWLAGSEAVEMAENGRPENAPMTTSIVGGGPAGLATAIMLARMGYDNIKVLLGFNQWRFCIYRHGLQPGEV